MLCPLTLDPTTENDASAPSASLTAGNLINVLLLLIVNNFLVAASKSYGRNGKQTCIFILVSQYNQSLVIFNEMGKQMTHMRMSFIHIDRHGVPRFTSVLQQQYKLNLYANQTEKK